MAEVVKMPRLSDTMEEGTVAKWHKKVGDKVSEGDLLAEIETDKATMDFEAFQEGTLLYIGVDEGDTAAVESVLCILGEEGEDIEKLKEAGGSSQETRENQEKNQEEESESDEGDDEEKTDASKTDSDSKRSETDSKETDSKRSVSDSDGRIKASPLAKKLATEKGIDLKDVYGSGDGGRIVKDDIENFTPKKKTGSASAVSEDDYEDTKVSQMRKTIAKRLGESKFSAPHFYLTIEIDMQPAFEARKKINEIAASKISFNDIVVKACAAALKKHPAVNSSWMGDKIRQHNQVHIGVAVAVDEGLLVPVIQNADQKGMAEINGEVKEMAEKARAKKLQPDEMEGGTFAVSNLGMFGIEEFTAIINPPNSCIMAVGAMTEKPVVKDGQIAVGKRMKVTMSCDHRVVDGATGAKFLQTFQMMMENPLGMVL